VYPLLHPVALSVAVQALAFDGHLTQLFTELTVTNEYPVKQSDGVLAAVVQALAPSEVHLVQVVPDPTFEYPSRHEVISDAEVQALAPAGQAVHEVVVPVVYL